MDTFNTVLTCTLLTSRFSDGGRGGAFIPNKTGAGVASL